MTGPGQLVLRCVALVALLVGGIVPTALTHDWLLLVATIACLLAAAAAVAISVNAMLGEDDRADAAEPYRGPVAAFAAVVAIAVVLAIALPMEDATAVSTAVPDASSAAATVRAFLAAAVLDGNAYAACEYLAPSEQHVVATLAGYGQSCRTALSATEASLASVHSEGSLHALPMRVAVRDETAVVTTPRVRFVLRLGHVRGAQRVPGAFGSVADRIGRDRAARVTARSPERLRFLTRTQHCRRFGLHKRGPYSPTVQAGV